LAHVIKHVLGLPDTLHPNTYASILYLAAFTLVVATAGGGCGVFMRSLATGRVARNQRPAGSPVDLEGDSRRGRS
jgi:hypothetical protein